MYSNVTWAIWLTILFFILSADVKLNKYWRVCINFVILSELK